jgi:hypothetical protein
MPLTKVRPMSTGLTRLIRSLVLMMLIKIPEHHSLPDGYMMLPICVPMGRNMIPYPPIYWVKHIGYSGFGYLLPSLVWS